MLSVPGEADLRGTGGSGKDLEDAEDGVFDPDTVGEGPAAVDGNSKRDA